MSRRSHSGSSTSPIDRVPRMCTGRSVGEDPGVPLSLGGLLRSPSDLASAIRSVLGWTDEAVQVVADLPARVAALIDEAERLVARVGETLDRVDAAVGRVEGVVGDARTLVGRVDDVAGRGGGGGGGGAAGGGPG